MKQTTVKFFDGQRGNFITYVILDCGAQEAQARITPGKGLVGIDGTGKTRMIPARMIRCCYVDLEEL